MFKILTKAEALISLGIFLGAGALITYLINAVKAYFPIFANMYWQGWILLFITMSLAFSTVASIILYFICSAFREIRPLPKISKLGAKIHSIYAGPIVLDDGDGTAMTLGVKIWSNGKTLHATDYKLTLKNGKSEFQGHHRKLNSPINNVISGKLEY